VKAVGSLATGAFTILGTVSSSLPGPLGMAGMATTAITQLFTFILQEPPGPSDLELLAEHIDNRIKDVTVAMKKGFDEVHKHIDATIEVIKQTKVEILEESKRDDKWKTFKKVVKKAMDELFRQRNLAWKQRGLTEVENDEFRHAAEAIYAGKRCPDGSSDEAIRLYMIHVLEVKHPSWVLASAPGGEVDMRRIQEMADSRWDKSVEKMNLGAIMEHMHAAIHVFLTGMQSAISELGESIHQAAYKKVYLSGLEQVLKIYVETTGVVYHIVAMEFSHNILARLYPESNKKRVYMEIKQQAKQTLSELRRNPDARMWLWRGIEDPFSGHHDLAKAMETFYETAEETLEPPHFAKVLKTLPTNLFPTEGMERRILKANDFTAISPWAPNIDPVANPKYNCLDYRDVTDEYSVVEFQVIQKGPSLYYFKLDITVTVKLAALEYKIAIDLREPKLLWSVKKTRYFRLALPGEEMVKVIVMAWGEKEVRFPRGNYKVAWDWKNVPGTFYRQKIALFAGYELITPSFWMSMNEPHKICGTTLGAPWCLGSHKNEASSFPGVWKCHEYEDGQDNDWCNRSGSHEFTGGKNDDFPGCGDCWCCKRVWKCHEYEEDQDDDWCTRSGSHEFTGGKNDKFPGCGDCRCCKHSVSSFVPDDYETTAELSNAFPIFSSLFDTSVYRKLSLPVEFGHPQKPYTLRKRADFWEIHEQRTMAGWNWKRRGIVDSVDWDNVVSKDPKAKVYLKKSQLWCKNECWKDGDCKGFTWLFTTEEIKKKKRTGFQSFDGEWGGCILHGRETTIQAPNVEQAVDTEELGTMLKDEEFTLFVRKVNPQQTRLFGVLAHDNGQSLGEKLKSAEYRANRPGDTWTEPIYRCTGQVVGRVLLDDDPKRNVWMYAYVPFKLEQLGDRNPDFEKSSLPFHSKEEAKKQPSIYFYVEGTFVDRKIIYNEATVSTLQLKAEAIRAKKRNVEWMNTLRGSAFSWSYHFRRSERQGVGKQRANAVNLSPEALAEQWKELEQSFAIYKRDVTREKTGDPDTQNRRVEGWVKLKEKDFAQELIRSKSARIEELTWKHEVVSNTNSVELKESTKELTPRDGCQSKAVPFVEERGRTFMKLGAFSDSDSCTKNADARFVGFSSVLTENGLTVETLEDGNWLIVNDTVNFHQLRGSGLRLKTWKKDQSTHTKSVAMLGVFHSGQLAKGTYRQARSGVVRLKIGHFEEIGVVCSEQGQCFECEASGGSDAEICSAGDKTLQLKDGPGVSYTLRGESVEILRGEWENGKLDGIGVSFDSTRKAQSEGTFDDGRLVDGVTWSIDPFSYSLTLPRTRVLTYRHDIQLSQIPRAKLRIMQALVNRKMVSIDKQIESANPGIVSNEPPTLQPVGPIVNAVKTAWEAFQGPPPSPGPHRRSQAPTAEIVEDETATGRLNGAVDELKLRVKEQQLWVDAQAAKDRQEAGAKEKAFLDALKEKLTSHLDLLNAVLTPITEPRKAKKTEASDNKGQSRNVPRGLRERDLRRELRRTKRDVAELRAAGQNEPVYD